jgi:hypothetical protein
LVQVPLLLQNPPGFDISATGDQADRTMTDVRDNHALLLQAFAPPPKFRMDSPAFKDDPKGCGIPNPVLKDFLH